MAEPDAGGTISQRIVDTMPWLDDLANKIQPAVQRAVARGGKPAKNVLDGLWMGVPLHPVLTDVPVGSWTATLVFDGVELVSGSRFARDTADGTLAFGIAGGLAAAAAGVSDWRYLSGGSRRMGLAHGLLNAVGLALNIASLGYRISGRRRAGQLLFLTGYSLNGMGAHLGGELSYWYGLRVNRNVFEGPGPEEFVPVMDESELPEDGMRRVETDGVGILLARTTDGEVRAIAARCNHFSGPLEEGEREGDTVVCPWHQSRFDLNSGEPLEGPAVFPQSRYETRVRDGNIEIRAVAGNAQRKVR
ncbi:hypothetical protein BH24ACT16_BH24ACT16_08130 [soil metagenome]|jgi:nitrite reductase/ring-hydroxylating ferredoxin subunit/uncharacterized membrane protein